MQYNIYYSFLKYNILRFFQKNLYKKPEFVFILHRFLVSTHNKYITFCVLKKKQSKLKLKITIS